MAKWDSMDGYTFDLRQGLRDAAKVGLTQLEEMIGELGYGWLDGHMESIMERTTSRAPMAELMKTPSRTQTVKKTRAVTTAMKDRTDKINRINNSLLGSPLSKASPSRPPLSPLQPRAVNAQLLSPTPLTYHNKPPTPAKSPLRAIHTPTKGGVGRKPKTAVLADENVRPAQLEQATDVQMLSPTPKKSARIAALKSPGVKSPGPRSPGPKSPLGRSKEAQTIEQVFSPSRQTAQKEQIRPEATKIVQSVPAVQPIQAASTTEQTAPSASHLPTTIEGTEVEPEEPVGDDNIADRATTSTEVAIDQIKPVETEYQTSHASAAPFTLFHHPLPSTSTAPPVPSDTRAPVRQVRSSWLSKALGNGSVPITDMSGVRKSYAASGPRQTSALDLNPLRKSIAPTGVLASAGQKRPSDGGAEEEMRPEKILKLDSVMRTSESANPPSVAPVASTSTQPLPSAPVTSIEETDTHSLPTDNKMRERGRSDIHKVTKALDELRERAAAKEAHKQKAALAASGGPRHTTSASHEHRQSTAGVPAQVGFFKGLSSLGAGLGRSLGLGGTAKSAEEEALRLQQELEEEEAQAERDRQELDRLMGEGPVEKGEDKEDEVEEAMEAVGHRPTELPAVASTTMVVVEEPRSVRATTVELQDEDMIADALADPAPVRVVEEAESAPKPTPVARPPTPPVMKITTLTTPHRASQYAQESTTPIMSPPKRLFNQPIFKLAPQVETIPFIQPKHAPVARLESGTKRPEVQVASHPVKVAVAAPEPMELDQDVDELKEDDELPELPEPIEADDESTDTEEPEEEDVETRELPAKKMFKSDTDVQSKHKKIPSLTSTNSLASLAQSSSSSAGAFGHASMIGGKTLGFKPSTGPVKSVQLAAAAAKKEQATAEKRVQQKEQLEQRRADAAKRKEEAEKAKAEEEKKAKMAEIEEKRKLRAELDRKRKEREERLAIAAKEKAAKEEAERVAAKAKTDEETKKRKLAQAALLNKSGPAKKVAMAPSASASSVQPIVKGKEPLRSIKPVMPQLGQPVPPAGQQKLGPTSFRTAENTTSVATGSTISLVQRPVIGPPSRPSQQLPLQHQYQQFQPQQHGHNGFAQHGSGLQHGQGSKPSSVLQQSRVQLQSQLDQKVLEQQSEDIVLPDIASEYSDSDDSDKEGDWKAPKWAESPDLRAALAAQASRNPDEIFGPIKPLDMEELFKVKTNKFRARTSSANWNGGDRLTKMEEVEYARRMGFKPIERG